MYSVYMSQRFSVGTQRSHCIGASNPEPDRLPPTLFLSSINQAQINILRPLLDHSVLKWLHMTGKHCDNEAAEELVSTLLHHGSG